MSLKLAALAAWLLVVAFFGVLGLIYLYDLAKSNRVTYGEIIETYPEMHSTCKYRYSVEGGSMSTLGDHAVTTK
jgi:hypothetical protein